MTVNMKEIAERERFSDKFVLGDKNGHNTMVIIIPSPAGVFSNE